MDRGRTKKFDPDKKSKILGMCKSKARRILISKLIYKLFSTSDDKPYCFRCGEMIEDLQFHIDHKIAWMSGHDAISKYFDVNNIALSHPICNSMARRSTSTRTVKERIINQVANISIWNKTYYKKIKQLKDE